MTVKMKLCPKERYNIKCPYGREPVSYTHLPLPTTPYV